MNKKHSPKHFAKQFGAAPENTLIFYVFYINWSGKALQLIHKYVVQVFQPFLQWKMMKKLLNFEIRHDHSLDDQKKLPPAAARCASENQNYACEYDQCSPAFTLRFWGWRVFGPCSLYREQPAKSEPINWE